MTTVGIPRTMPARRVLLIEDEGLLRSLLASALESAGFEVHACATAAQAQAAVGAFDPDAVISDIDLGVGANGIDLVVALLREAPHLVSIVLSNYAITPDRRQGELSRVTYLRKQDVLDPLDLVGTLNALLGDELPPSHDGGPAAARLAGLTAVQVEVLRMIAAGASNAEIAARRGTSMRAAEHLVQRTFAALGLTSDPAVNARVRAARIYLDAAGRPSR